ncbi:MAG: two-component system response regulator [Methylophilaceae bacterium]|nr:MAG: two-component system response regulator [Methylophilaceae bacterium]
MQILLVDDDDVAVESVIRSMKKFEVTFPIVVAEDGQIALDILRGTHPTRKLEAPFLILLDLNMPNLNGFEFLEAVRRDPELNRAIVFVLTTSGSDADKIKAYNENIAGYMVKNMVGPQFSRLFTLLNNYAETVAMPV